MPPDRLHGYVIDCATGQLDRLKALECCRRAAPSHRPTIPDRILRVLVQLVEELEHRAGHDHSSTAAHIVLVVNDVGPLLRSLELGGEFEQGRDCWSGSSATVHCTASPP